MNRRSFFRSILVASVAPTIFVPQFEHGLWKKTLAVYSPAYNTAQYEFLYYYDEGALGGGNWVPYPVRESGRPLFYRKLCQPQSQA